MCCKYLRNESLDLHEIWNLGSQDSIWPPWRSEFSLSRYLQNNIGICLIHNFQCILHIFKIWASKFLKRWKVVQILLMFLMLILKWKLISKNFVIHVQYILELCFKTFQGISNIFQIHAEPLCSNFENMQNALQIKD